jgi:HPt (histidine-containing phosphotransfer) domain-containing protein
MMAVAELPTVNVMDFPLMAVQVTVDGVDFAAVLGSAQLHVPTERPAIDQASLAELRGLPGEDGEDLLQSVIQMFLEDTPQALAGLRTALATADARAVERIAHTVKGSSAYFGAYRFQDLCNAMETAGNAGDLAPVGELLSKTGHELQRVVAALEIELALQLL